MRSFSRILNLKRGFSIVESVIAISIIGTFVVVLAGVNNIYLNIAFSNNEKFRAYFLAEEGLEAVKAMRDQDWSEYIGSLLPGNDYRLSFEAPIWRSYAGAINEEGFTRVLRVEDVYRDGSDNIAPSGTLDPNTKLIKVSVSWQMQTGIQTVELDTYITNLFDT